MSEVSNPCPTFAQLPPTLSFSAPERSDWGRNREEKTYTTTTERKSFGEPFWPQRKTFQAGGGYKNPIKTRKTISTIEILPLWTPFFSAKKSFCTGAGRCMVFFFSQRKQKIKEKKRKQIFYGIWDPFDHSERSFRPNVKKSEKKSRNGFPFRPPGPPGPGGQKSQKRDFFWTFPRSA